MLQELTKTELHFDGVRGDLIEVYVCMYENKIARGCNTCLEREINCCVVYRFAL